MYACIAIHNLITRSYGLGVDGEALPRGEPEREFSFDPEPAQLIGGDATMNVWRDEVAKAMWNDYQLYLTSKGVAVTPESVRSQV